MKIFLNILAILLFLVGIVWILQGVDILGGSSMTGQTQWTIIGAIAALVGIILGVFTNRRKVTTPSK